MIITTKFGIGDYVVVKTRPDIVFMVDRILICDHEILYKSATSNGYSVIEADLELIRKGKKDE